LLVVALLAADDVEISVAAQKTRTASEAEGGPTARGAHPTEVRADVLKACRAELLQENYLWATMAATSTGYTLLE
jgi:hypothetical protein